MKIKIAHIADLHIGSNQYGIKQRQINQRLSCIKLANETNKYDLIIGVPRSGLIPASLISFQLNKPLATVKEFIHNDFINGFRSGEVQIFNPNGDYFITHNTTQ